MELISSLAKALAQHALEGRLPQYPKTWLLINRCADGCVYDELGYVPLDPNFVYLFFQLISRCYQRGSVLITPNRLFMEWWDKA